MIFLLAHIHYAKQKVELTPCFLPFTYHPMGKPLVSQVQKAYSRIGQVPLLHKLGQILFFPGVEKNPRQLGSSHAKKCRIFWLMVSSSSSA